MTSPYVQSADAKARASCHVDQTRYIVRTLEKPPRYAFIGHAGAIAWTKDAGAAERFNRSDARIVGRDANQAGTMATVEVVE